MSLKFSFLAEFLGIFNIFLKNRNIYDVLPCNASLVKIWYKSDFIWGSNP